MHPPAGNGRSVSVSLGMFTSTHSHGKDLVKLDGRRM